MAELKTVSAPVREQLAKGYKPAGVGVKTRRQLKQDRSRLASQQRQAVFEQFETVDRIVRQPLPVGDKFGRFQANTKSSPVWSRQLLTASGVGVR